MTAGLNDNHKRHLLNTFEHVDGLLSESLWTLNSAETPSPFQRYQPNSLPIQRKVIADHIARLRGIMTRILESHGIAIPKPHVSALWSFRTGLMFAMTAVEELAPKYMRGYGELSDEAIHELEVLQTQVMEVLERMIRFLAEGAGQDLQARLKRMEKTTHEVEVVKLVAEVVTAHGLTELRPSLDAVIERLESSSFEVAVFGRVSSGKSSLLDYILQTDVLPVGVTPVTALPTRIIYGTLPVARVWFAEGNPVSVDPRELKQFATEQGNPDNARHVTRIQVELPVERLKDGVTFVDTPGLGSLARYGEMEAMAYLPRCDLGIVLVDANSTFTHEDAFIVNALCQAGVKVMVLLAKADMLTTDEQATASQYIREQVRTNVGIDLPVYAISVRGGDAALCDRWFETVLMPCLQEHHRLSKASLRRKTGLLREAVVSALRRRMDKGSAPGGDRAKQWSTVEPSLDEALTRLDMAMRERLEWPGLGDRILDAAAKEIAEKWRRDSILQVDATAAVISHGSLEVSLMAAEATRPMAPLREYLTKLLQEAALAAGLRQDEGGVPVPSGMPILDLSAHLRETLLRRPRLAAFSGRLAYRNARRQLEETLGARLADLLDKYVRQMRQWYLETLTEMRQVFAARVGFYRVHCEQAASSSDLASVEADLRRLQVLHGDMQE